MPTRAWVSAKRARSEATRKSQASASSKPPVTADAVDGADHGVAASAGAGPRCVAGAAPSAGRAGAPPPAPSSFRSSPAQKAGSAPVRTMASTSSSASSVARPAVGSAVRRAAVRGALRASGRLRVTVATRRRPRPAGHRWSRPGIGGHRSCAARSVPVVERSGVLDRAGGSRARGRPADQRGGDPAAHGREVVVEDGAVGQGGLVELVGALVGHLDGVLGSSRSSSKTVSTVGPDRSSRSSPIGGLVLGQHATARLGVGLRGQALHPQHDLDLDAGRLVDRLADVPGPVGGLGPGGPVEGDVGLDPWRQPLAGQAVGGLPGRCRRAARRPGTAPRRPAARGRRFSKASRRAPMASVKTWSSMGGAGYRQPLGGGSAVAARAGSGVMNAVATDMPTSGGAGWRCAGRPARRPSAAPQAVAQQRGGGVEVGDGEGQSEEGGRPVARAASWGRRAR